MKKLLILLAVATLPAASGCACARLCPCCPCNWFNRPATYCAPACPPTYAAAVGSDLSAAVCTVCAGSDRRSLHASDGSAIRAAMRDLPECAGNDASSTDVLSGPNGRWRLLRRAGLWICCRGKLWRTGHGGLRR